MGIRSAQKQAKKEEGSRARLLSGSPLSSLNRFRLSLLALLHLTPTCSSCWTSASSPPSHPLHRPLSRPPALPRSFNSPSTQLSTMRTSASLAVLSLLSASAVTATGIVDMVTVAAKLAVSFTHFE